MALYNIVCYLGLKCTVLKIRQNAGASEKIGLERSVYESSKPTNSLSFGGSVPLYMHDLPGRENGALFGNFSDGKFLCKKTKNDTNFV